MRRPEVIEACTVGVPDARYGEEVVAYVVLRPGARRWRSPAPLRGGAASLQGAESVGWACRAALSEQGGAMVSGYCNRRRRALQRRLPRIPVWFPGHSPQDSALAR